MKKLSHVRRVVSGSRRQVDHGRCRIPMVFDCSRFLFRASDGDLANGSRRAPHTSS
jgi:hypothetical protein